MKTLSEAVVTDVEQARLMIGHFRHRREEFKKEENLLFSRQHLMGMISAFGQIMYAYGRMKDLDDISETSTYVSECVHEFWHALKEFEERVKAGR